MNTFSLVVHSSLGITDRDRYASSAAVGQYIINASKCFRDDHLREGDWHSDGKAIESLAASTDVAMPSSEEVGRKFRELIQDEKVKRRDRCDMDRRDSFTRR